MVVVAGQCDGGGGSCHSGIDITAAGNDGRSGGGAGGSSAGSCYYRLAPGQY